MKALIFLLITALVVSVIVWAMRKSQAKADLARRQSIERRKKKRKEDLTPQEYMEWPVIIRPVKGDGSPDAEPDSDRGGDSPAVEEPSMTTIEFEPSEKVAK